MVSNTLERRVERLEQSGFGGGDDCPRCRDTIIVRGSGAEEDLSVTRNGVRLSPEAARSFAAEERPNGICPDCGRKRKHVRVGWGDEEARNRLNLR
jgi:ssDNA-binding Zn-finger/Zn-ribbon topoisomerase 1